MNHARLRADLLAGLPWLGLLAVASWPLAAIGAAYVVIASAYLAVVHRPALRLVPWPAAAAIWAVLLSAPGSPDSEPGWPLAALVGAAIGSVAFVVWRLTALLIRYGPSPAPTWTEV